MASKTFDVLAPKASKSSKKDVPAVPVSWEIPEVATMPFLGMPAKPGKSAQVVRAYVRAVRVKKEAERRMKLLEPVLHAKGLAEVAGASIAAAKPVSSVNLMDQGTTLQSGAVQCTVADSYGEPDVAKLQEMLSQTHAVYWAGGSQVRLADVVASRLKAEFDLAAFFEGGQFRAKKLSVFMAGLRKLAAECGMSASPVKVSKVPVVRPGFHARRMTELTPEENAALQKVLPARISLRVV